MTSRLSLGLFLCLCVGWAAGLATPARAEPALLKVCVEAVDVRPWRTHDQRGLNFDLLNAAAVRAGVRLAYVPLPWKRCLAELKANAVDGALAASFRPDRLELGAYPGGTSPDANKRLHTDTYVIVRKRGNRAMWDGKGFSQLDQPVGIQLGYSVGADLAAMNVPVDEGSGSLGELLLKLVAERIGAAAGLASEIRHYLADNPEMARQVEVLPAPLVEKPYYLMLSHALVKNRPALAEQLWNAIEEVRKSPDYRKAERAALEPRAR